MKETRGNVKYLDRIIQETLFTRQEIDTRYGEMAVDFRKNYKHENPLIVGVALGGVIFTRAFTAELQRQDPNFRFDLAYITAGTYLDGTESSGKTEIISGFRPEGRAKGRDVAYFDDVIDRGITGGNLIDYANEEEANSAELVALVRKAVPDQDGPEPFMIGFGAPNKWLLGEGMDWRGMGRNLGRIVIMNEVEAKKLEREMGWAA